MKFTLAQPAKEDLSDIVDYIATFDVSAASRVLRDIRKACSELAKTPSLGHVRPEICKYPGIRVANVRRTYLLVYRCSNGILQVLRVIHGARDLGRALEGTIEP